MLKGLNWAARTKLCRLGLWRSIWAHGPSFPKYDEDIKLTTLRLLVNDLFRAYSQVILSPLAPLQQIVARLDELKMINGQKLTRMGKLINEISYEGSSDEIAVESRTLETLGNLSKYSWALKALLVLADFALEYKESYQLGKSVAILKEVPDPNSKPTNLKKRQEAIIQLDSLMMGTLKVVKFIVAPRKIPFVIIVHRMYLV
ncbi:hypothetical protein DVH24_001767 [Malus domestica]|uniref:Sieve element occlusion N-terminal domain-containing protein n=1 Tax=Malus domestica TaxID=3750 RepID=A0A498I5S4_MALDO|nr:hypothetical protein DVH24_001767 [Malus domestica]